MISMANIFPLLGLKFFRAVLSLGNMLIYIAIRD